MAFNSSLVKTEQLERSKTWTNVPREIKFLVEINQQPWPENKPLVSVVVPCFNYGAYINSALDSVLSQSFQNFEIIVVEGGSTDGITPSIVKKIKHPKIRVFIRYGRHLVGDNRNFGISKAQGKYFCCLDPDDVLNPMFLERALFLLECGGYDMVSTNYRFFGEQNNEIALPSRPSFAQMIGGAALANVIVCQKKFWKKIGGYRDTGIGSQYIPEDWDFYMHAAGLGARIYNLQEPLLNVRWHADSLSRDPLNPSYAVQLQTLRKRHKKVLQHKNFEHFDDRNESVVKVSSGTINLINRQTTSQNFGTLIIPPLYLNDEEIDMHLRHIGNIDANGNIALMCYRSVADLPDILRERYGPLTAQFSSNIFSVAEVANDHMLKTTLLDYLIETRQIKKFIVGSAAFDQKNKVQLFELYDRL